MRAFLETELRGFIEQRWRSNDEWVLAGHSLSALFAISMFAQQESGFTRFIAMSPVLGWQGGIVLERARRRVERAGSRAVRLFLSTANEGERYPPTAVQSLDSLLKAREPSAISWMYRQYQAEDHGSTVVPALFDGLRFALLPRFPFNSQTRATPTGPGTRTSPAAPVEWRRRAASAESGRAQ
jgi:uncharacterized protein